jgi:N-acetylglucosamine-6-phosphate deacetylase
MIVFSASRLFTPEREIKDPLLFVEDGRISAVSSRAHWEVPSNATLVDFGSVFGDAIIAPGYFDIHMHGGAGVDVMRASPSELPQLNRFLASRGVTTYFPTTVAAPLDETCRALERMADAIESGETSAAGNGASALAVPVGVHLEGPFLSHKRRGVHPPEYLANPTIDVFERLWQAARGRVRMMTIAPELPGAPEVIEEASRRNVCVSLGHSDATLEFARAGFQAGARHATHTFNAMRPLDHRDPGILGEVLTNADISADIIADGIHVAPEVIQIFLRAKGAELSVLITDAMAAAGMPDGKYMLGPIEVEVKNGKCTKDGQLAGSALTMDTAVRNVMKFARWGLRESVQMASLNPARSVHLGEYGELKPGAEANFVVLSPEGEVKKTIVRGQGF